MKRSTLHRSMVDVLHLKVIKKPQCIHCKNNDEDEKDICRQC